MTPEIWVALISSIAPVLGAVAAVGALVVSLRNGKKVDKVSENVKANEVEIDLVRTGSFRQGHVAGQEYQRKQTDFGGLGK